MIMLMHAGTPWPACQVALRRPWRRAAPTSLWAKSSWCANLPCFASIAMCMALGTLQVPAQACLCVCVSMQICVCMFSGSRYVLLCQCVAQHFATWPSSARKKKWRGGTCSAVGGPTPRKAKPSPGVLRCLLLAPCSKLCVQRPSTRNLTPMSLF